MDIKDIKDLIVSIDNSNIETIEIEKNDFRIMISKSKSVENSERNLYNPIQYKEVKQDDNPIQEESREVDDGLIIVKSPMVGTFYASSSPDLAPFVKVGDRIEKGQTLCIIEAMKIMNEIEAEVSGEVLEILVDNEDIVEYGQALMKVRR
ncbi:MAG TPA: acetyl-CoA carboxylase biotin carboxyl carrier protein [Tissierellaceae bacterium]|nr:acetyl-CoA carboxylase biotin carboxyl carrier protein [Tissierellaceae bacterium]